MARVTPTGKRTIAIQPGRLSKPLGSAFTVIAVDNPAGGTTTPFDLLILQDR